MIEYSQENKKVYLLAVHLKSQKLEITESSLEELDSMARSLDFNVIGQTYQTRVSPDSKSYFGQGKLNEIKEIIASEKVDIVLFDHDLSPNQGKFIETYLDCMVLDRTQLILEIFAQHAKTPESKNQVELAQLKYMLPRLVGMWAHLDREKGGIGASKGTGEKQINIDRSLIRKRIHQLELALKKVAKERKVQNKKRSECFQVGIVGYTNAGKTSLMNLLTGVNLLAQDKLFATLESTTRILSDTQSPNILLSDTVGFIRNLPHNLVASFRSTLSVVREADLLLHVVDGSSQDLKEHIKTTEAVLKEIDASNIPVLLVLNKMDQVTEKLDRLILAKEYVDAIFCSSKDDELVSELKQAINHFFDQKLIQKETTIPYSHAGLISKLYQISKVENIAYEEHGIQVSHAMTQTNERIFDKILQDMSLLN